MSILEREKKEGNFVLFVKEKWEICREVGMLSVKTVGIKIHAVNNCITRKPSITRFGDLVFLSHNLTLEGVVYVVQQYF